MRFLYFTKFLQSLDVAGLIAFAKQVGLDGFDLAVRPGFPIHPGNARTALPAAARLCQDAGVPIGLLSTATNLADPRHPDMVAMFEAAAEARVPAIKIGYFRTQGRFDAELPAAQKHLAEFANLSRRTGVRTLYHTHSGTYLGNNGAGLRLLLAGCDAHQIGAYVDTGHVAINGGPFPQEVDLARPWLTMIAIKDMAWERSANAWTSKVVPAGRGIVRWPEVAKGLKAVAFDGPIVLHGEYETKDHAERTELARQELTFLKKTLAS